MIEFKADCGHTIRAKDEDEGKVVRCSYCGKDAQVPQDEDNTLDFLFSEVERSGAHAAITPSPKAGRRARKAARRPPRADGEFDWTDSAKKMAFFAVLISAVIVVWKVVVPALTQANQRAERSPPAAPVPQETNPSAPAYGLVAVPLESGKGGLYVNSVPNGARVYVRKAGGGKDSILHDPEVDRSVRAERTVQLVAGRYEVAVAMVLNDPALMRIPGYTDVRRTIESGAAGQRISEFFVPDGSRETLADDVPDMPRLVLRKYDVAIGDKQWTPLVALFLPDAPIDELLRHIPARSAFRFDPAHVQDELTYYQVPRAEQRYVMDALERIGTIVYRKPAGDGYHVFSINLTEGWISHRELPRLAIAERDERSRPRPGGGDKH